MTLKKGLLYCLLAICFSFNLSAQVFEPVKWETSVEKISDSEYDLISIASIDSGWHLYSQVVPEGGPIPTTFSYKDNSSYKKIGETNENEGHVVDDPVFDMKIKFFENKNRV